MHPEDDVRYNPEDRVDKIYLDKLRNTEFEFECSIEMYKKETEKSQLVLDELNKKQDSLESNIDKLKGEKRALESSISELKKEAKKHKQDVDRELALFPILKEANKKEQKNIAVNRLKRKLA